MAKNTFTRKTVTENINTERTARTTSNTPNFEAEQAIFGRQNFLWMGIGAALIGLGLLLMSGGQQPSADVWDPNVIYSTRIITIAPIVILIGLAVEIYAIFKN